MPWPEKAKHLVPQTHKATTTTTSQLPTTALAILFPNPRLFGVPARLVLVEEELADIVAVLVVFRRTGEGVELFLFAGRGELRWRGCQES